MTLHLQYLEGQLLSLSTEFSWDVLRHKQSLLPVIRSHKLIRIERREVIQPLLSNFNILILSAIVRVIFRYMNV